MADKERILVADDEAVIRELMTDVLEDEGYVVDTAENGRQALEILRGDGEYIILLTDIMMPEMDGIELIREAHQIRPMLIPIVMTGFATLDTARAAVKEGAYDYVLKPFSLTEIKLAVSNALERYRLANDNARLREITELFNISETIAGIHDERQLLEFVLNAALEHVSAKRGSLMITTEDGRSLEVATSVGLPEEARGSMVKMGEGISGLVAQRVQPMFVTDIRECPDIAERSRRLHDASFISVPLERKMVSETGAVRNSPRVIAVLNVNEKRDGTSFNEGDLKVLSIVANHASAAIENVRLIRDIEEAHLGTLKSMALMLEAKDPYTHGHSQRVRDYAVLAAERLGLSREDIEVLKLGAALHDLGKVGVPDTVLNKNGRPTDEEWELIKQHPVIGHEVLSPVRFLKHEHLELVRNHHERVDGRGYPDGLAVSDLSLLVRIIVAADSYDAMASNRAYRMARDPHYIIGEFKKNAGAQFDQKVAQLFIEMIEAGEIAS
ncbi:MAG TPA: response regulator [Candidatus Hydrogenedentes bacterium]|nr:response regulator [Candidatus Hydrogenedentota bacterium]HPG66749.1 response regulator [Candidatus Hydrogenedentota bacterium]